MEETEKVGICGKRNCEFYKEQTVNIWQAEAVGNLTNFKSVCPLCTEFTGLNLYEAKKDG